MIHNTLKICILSDYFMFRKGIEIMLPAAEGFVVVQSLPCDPSSVDQLRKASPDIVLYDFHSCPHKMLDSILILEPISEFAKVVVIVSARWQRMFKGIRIYGYHSVEHGIDMLKDLLHTVAADSSKYTIETNHSKRIGLAAYSALTKRELEVVRHVAMGKTSREIAETLHIAIKTVEVHRHNILSKLGLSKSNRLVNYMTNSAYFVKDQ